ncbi:MULTISPECIES: hypothetical protein [unclassified Microbacterium]|uniref:hypothetical protein n=1 Tax=unclassified Microbacterium TaxID=2609290 RepID=UPI003431B802
MTLVQVLAVASECEGYACPPEHSVPISEAIVRRVPEGIERAVDLLAATGGDLWFLIGGLVVSAVLSIGGAVLLTRRGRSVR